jgi:hypothetical protein
MPHDRVNDCRLNNPLRKRGMLDRITSGDLVAQLS